MIKIAYICLSGTNYGLGHLKRALLFKENFKNKKINIDVINTNETNVKIRPTNLNYKFLRFNIKNINTLIKNNYEYIFLDVVNNNFLIKKNNNETLKYLLSYSSSKLIIFDTIKKYSVTKLFLIPKQSIIICPYVDNINNNYNHKLLTLKGLKYFVFSKKIKKKIILKKNPKNILISVGGSDHNENMYKILENLEFNKKYNFLVILGPFFNKIYLKKIIKLLDDYENVFYKYNPNSIEECINWSDIVISASGLTKYDIAYSRTPSIIFSIDKEHHQINKGFESLNLSYYIGDIKKLNNINKYLSFLINNSAFRNKIHLSCKKLFDDNAFDRIYKYLK